jgi:ATP-binding cassette subfamily F protein uup
MSELLLSLVDATVTFGNKPLFEDLSMNIHSGDRVCLVGKNGAGKTTIMHMITGYKELDKGKRIVAPNAKVGYLQQEEKFNPNHTVFEHVFSALPEEKQNDNFLYEVDMVMDPLELNPNDKMGIISGGQLRRAALAHALVSGPDILLLDEPTNHLDLTGIEWLEDYLKNYRGSFLCVSHDKTFLKNISNKVFWLDRGRIRVCPEGFAKFDEWSEMLLDHESRELQRRNKIVAEEMAWASKGIKARRKRNVRRVEEVKIAREKLKADLSSYKKAVKKIEFSASEAEFDSKVVGEFYNVGKVFDCGENSKKTILNKFNLKINNGDRIGIIGKNGSGKTTFLKLLLGELKPDFGTIKLSKNIEISYFDQKRQDLNPDNTLWETLCPAGGDHVNVGGKLKHVCGYLKDFMFDPKDARSLVGTLSGGQKNRLMLTKILANPSSFLILDEPTNDLDMDTLDMLEEILSTYKGTLFVVSHDRDFLDQIVTKILAFHGDARVEEFIGGYTDYFEEVIKGKNPEKYAAKKPAKQVEKVEEKTEQNKSKKLSYKFQYELDNLPEKIEKLEIEVAELTIKLQDADLYNNKFDEFQNLSNRLGKAHKELELAEQRWLELSEQSS